MKKLNKLIVLVLAIVMITAAFAPAALAAYAPSSWSSWTPQSKGSNGTYVFALQNVLKGNYYLASQSGFTVDGVFGDGTKQVVIRFQQGHTGLSVDGVVGTQTWSKMYTYLRKNTSTSIYEPLLDRYTNYYGVYNIAKSSYSADWFRDINYGGSKSWATNRDGSRGTWHNIMDS